MVAQWRISGGGSGATRLLLLIFVLCSCSIISVAPKRDSAASSSHHLLQGHGHEPNPDKGGGGGLYPPRENREKKDGDGGLSTKSGKARKEEEVEGVEENGWRRLIGNKTRSGAATTATDEIEEKVILVDNAATRLGGGGRRDHAGGDKPTKYHYYPHNQHLYLLPECATQQVCSAVYLRLNYSQPLCACPSGGKPCSVSTRRDDRHTIPLVTGGGVGSRDQVLTLVKTCEMSGEVRECSKAKDWSILALQNSRTGKAHYLVICRCPSPGYLEGPVAHSQPAYARVPGIRVYGMTCIQGELLLERRSGRVNKSPANHPPWTTPAPSPSVTTLPRGAPWGRLKALLHNLLEHVQ